MTKIDELVATWLSSANTTVSHPSDTDRLNKLVLHGYKRVKGFSSAMLIEKMEEHGHNFDEDGLERIAERVNTLLAFCRSNYPKPPSKEQIAYNIKYDPKNGSHRH